MTSLHWSSMRRRLSSPVSSTLPPRDPPEDEAHDSGPALVHLARALHLKNAELQPTLDAIIAHAVQTIEPAEHAGLILVLDGRLVPQATLGAPPQILDSLQQQTGTGPCIDAARAQSVITINNT